MYSIEDIARLAGVSRPVLRHYAEIGLFTPVEVGTNGYRRYAPSQTGRLHRILALKYLADWVTEIQLPVERA